MNQPILTLQKFYYQMNRSRDIRLRITQTWLCAQEIDSADISELTRILLQLEAIPRSDKTYKLYLDETRMIDVDLTYEIDELKKDLFFLAHSMEEFEQYLMTFCPTFQSEVTELVHTLQGISFHTFITDRDGTVNNYCGRYASSIQSIYNAVFLCQYAKTNVNHAVILTSAPLKDIGLMDISVSPPGYYIYAASKGREYVDTTNAEHHFPIHPDQAHKIEELNQRLNILLKRPEYEAYTLIGSGLQFKFGQTTVARQDISESIDPRKSLVFKQMIENLVREIDPQGQYFRLEDTGKDIEIILTIQDDTQKKGVKDFDKGDAIHFLDQDIPLYLSQGPALVCGDTASDLPMMVATQSLTNETWGVLVTTDADLISRAKKQCNNMIFVSSPDILVTALYQLSNLSSESLKKYKAG